MIRALIFDLFDVLFTTELSPECQKCEMRLQLADYSLRTAMLYSPQFREAIYGRASQEVLWHIIVISAQVRTTKPHPEIYQIAAERLNVAPHEVIYVDDERRFVVGVEATGM